MKQIIVVAAIACALAPRPGFSQGITVQVTAPIALRQAPPEQRASAFASPPGAEIRQLAPGQQLRVDEQRDVRTLAERSRWLRVRTPDGQAGWIYAGDAAGAVSTVKQK